MKENIRIETKKQEKGITLIALVITIIVLLILAGVSIVMLTGENGILTQADNAKDETIIGEEKEQISLGYNNYKILKMEEMDNPILVVEGADVIGSEKEDWIITFKKTKHEYLLTGEGDIEKKKIDLSEYGLEDENIGDYIAYDCYTGVDETKLKYEVEKTDSGASNNQIFEITDLDKDLKWRILGIEKGKILITTEGVTDTNLYLLGQRGYINGVEILNNIGALYGQGKYAKSGRSISVEDINTITGYNPQKTGTGESYGKGTINEYGNEVTYSKSENENIKFRGSNGVEGKIVYNNFAYYDEQNNNFKGLKNGETTKLKANCYTYYPKTLTINSEGEQKGIAIDSVKYQMLFKKTYYLANNYIIPYSDGAGLKDCIYSIYSIVNGMVGTSNYMYMAHGYNGWNNNAIRPVVYLKSNIRLTRDEDGIWQISDSI
ncbi:MAG: hypothetical protein HFJ38_01455 [Bacilli bacterium]|nr:hypothetical protein [Bacilli bacterium]